MTHCNATAVCHFWNLSVRPVSEEPNCRELAEPSVTPWNAERPAVEFGVKIGEYHGVVRVPRRVVQRLLPERPNPRAMC